MAHDYRATIHWQRGTQAFTDRRYARAHEWIFDGITVPGSSAPSVVKPPLSRTDAVDPEEALVAALSSCHMLFFLDYAARDGFRVDDYRDDAVGVMGRNASGKVAMAGVTLSPNVTYSGDKIPTAEDIGRFHHLAHEACYIANSVNFPVTVADVAPTVA